MTELIDSMDPAFHDHCEDCEGIDVSELALMPMIRDTEFSGASCMFFLGAGRLDFVPNRVFDLNRLHKTWAKLLSVASCT